MTLEEKATRFYVDMSINELRKAKFNRYQQITYNSLLYLDIIAYTENCTASYIAGLLNIAKSAVTLKLRELEQQGLIYKTQSEEDKRIFYLHMDEKILREYREYDSILRRALKEVEDKYTKDEISLLCGMLDTINQKFREEYTP